MKIKFLEVMAIAQITACLFSGSTAYMKGNTGEVIAWFCTGVWCINYLLKTNNPYHDQDERT